MIKSFFLFSLFLGSFLLCVEGQNSIQETPVQQCLQLLQNYTLSSNYTCVSDTSQQARFLFELLGDERIKYVSDFLTLFWSIQVQGIQASEKDKILLEALKLLFNQTITNPPQYVSHGTDHSVRVMKWSMELFSVSQVQQGLLNKYGLSASNAQFVLGFMGLLHDIGYADIDTHHVPKWLHAISSGIMVNYYLTNWTNGLGAQLLNGLANTSIVADFVQAIREHNWDDGFCKWTENNPQYYSQCSFNTSGNPYDPTSKTTPFLNSNQTYYRGYSYGYALSLPLKFAIRVADNLDAIRSRLTPVQNDPQLMKYFYRIYVDQPLRKAVGSSLPDDQLNSFRNDARARATIYANLQNATDDQKKVMNRADEQSFLHFYSNYVIDYSSISSDSWSIFVNLIPGSGDLNFDSHPGPGLYQINRLATSALSCITEGNSTFLDLVRFNFNIPLPDLDGANYIPLRAFTKKPVYDAHGQAIYPDGQQEEICDPFCDSTTIALTKSFEACLAPDNSIPQDCNSIDEAFAQIPPFTDLTYPSSSSSSPSSSESNNLIIIIIIVAVVAGILLVVNIFLIIKFALPNKKRGEYTEIK